MTVTLEGEPPANFAGPARELDRIERGWPNTSMVGSNRSTMSSI